MATVRQQYKWWRRRDRLTVWIGVVIMTILFVSTLAFVMHGVKEAAAARSTHYVREQMPEQVSLCPGDLLRFSINIETEREAVVEVVESWCREDSGFCPFELTVVNVANASSVYPPRIANVVRTVPGGRITPGRWRYVRSVSERGTGVVSDMVVVPFVVPDSCTPLAAPTVTPLPIP